MTPSWVKLWISGVDSKMDILKGYGVGESNMGSDIKPNFLPSTSVSVH